MQSLSIRRRILLALFAIGAVLGTVRADDPPVPHRTWYDRLNPFAGPAPAPGPRVRPVGPLSTESLLEVLRAEKEAYTRRLDVCHRLREIALQSNDDTLEAQANDLEKQATLTYRTRVAKLGVKSGGPLPPLPDSSSASATLDKNLGSGVAANPLTTGSKTTTDGKTATAKRNDDVRSRSGNWPCAPPAPTQLTRQVVVAEPMKKRSLSLGPVRG